MKLRADRAEDRQVQAKDRAEERSSRTPEQQLALLDHRLGRGIGAASERARLKGKKNA